MTELHARPAVSGFKGEVLRPGHAGYDEARQVFNAMVDRRPALIMRCTDTLDVVEALRTAREEHLSVSVYGGGHGVTGSAVAAGGLCIDLRPMHRVLVDPERRTAQVQGGCSWGEVDAVTQEHGLAVPGGRVSTTGVAGLALGSGSGWLERAFGYTCDNLLAAEVVTADGRVVVASPRENPDLFWALRGGGGNFGIVTDFTFRLHPVGPTVLGGMLLYPAGAATRLVRFWRSFMTDAPDEVGTALVFATAPPADFVPEQLRGRPMVAVAVCYAGDLERGREVMAPLVEFGPPAVDLVGPMPYVAVQRLIDEANPKGRRNYWTADFLEGLPDEAIETLVSHATHPVSPFAQVVVFPGGGALARVPDNATAFGQRGAPFHVHYLSMWTDPADDEANIAHTRAMARAMAPWNTGRVYLNFIGDEGPGRVEQAFGPERYERLRQIKRIWDPENVFWHNQNIPPAR